MTQLEQVRNKLKKDGFVTRDWCLNRRITRLGALIILLKMKAGNLKQDMKNTSLAKTMFITESKNQNQ